jgi:DNA mismatch repair protein MutS
MTKTTPLMQQYWALKEEYPDALLFFQVGDFYELFFDDAKKASAFLGITLTKRGKDKGEPIPLCGVPVHALDHYLAKLVKGGFCVALCQQLEQAVPGKMVKRGVTQVLTPGSLTDSKLLQDRAASYVLAFAPHNDQWSLLFAELMTAQLYATTLTAGSMKSLETELSRFFPDEIVLSSDSVTTKTFQTLFQKQGYFTSAFKPDTQMLEWAQEQLTQAVVEQVKANKALEQAMSTLYAYFKRNNEAALHEFNQLHFYEPDDYMILDAASQRNLELIKNNQDGTSTHSLVSVLDQTSTAMGARMLRKWCVRPLVNAAMLQHRLDVVEHLKNHHPVLNRLRLLLQSIGDIERVVGRIALCRARFEDFLHLKTALQSISSLRLVAGEVPYFLEMMFQSVGNFSELFGLLERALNSDPEKEWIIKGGYDARLDRLRQLVSHSHEALSKLEKAEQQATGITSLKIRYTNVYGYYIEITNANAALVPERYKRQQTLVGRERYMSPELQDLQQEIMTARNEIETVEKELFAEVQRALRPQVGSLRKTAHVLAQLDVLCSFAECAYERGYVRPHFHESKDIIIAAGKHPVVAASVGSSFIPNDTALTDDSSLWIITGPNMGGKSTYLRQTALICIMAQCGSFVPAKAAQLPLLDAIFTRIGASDNVAEGKSTFLVEMEETAHICRYATEKSLVILDEVGRGTSTFDGLAIAQAVIEYLHSQVKARGLFATHYHELTALCGTMPGIVNYHVASKQTEEGIIFLHTVVPGVAQGSFGLSVARLADLPPVVVARAYEVMHMLSSPFHTLERSSVIPAVRAGDPEIEQLKTALRTAEKKLESLTSIDYEQLSPKKAFDLLWQIKENL